MRSAPAGIGCIVLAAGSGARFGSDKRLAEFAGDTLLAHTLARLAPIFTQRILVLRANADADTALAQRFASEWQIVRAPDAAKGMGHSLAAAMACTATWSGAVIALADMPFVRPETCSAIAARLSADTLVVPYYHGQRGNPVGIGSRFFAELAALQGDRGARALFERHASALVTMEVDDPGILRDVDTPSALSVSDGLRAADGEKEET
ncbi:MAG: nucleotidyltransferase family protein [Gammaproteobacteria bacterium]